MGTRRRSREIIIQVFYALFYAETDQNFKHLDYINVYKEVLDYIAIENDIKPESSVYLFAETSIKRIIVKIETLDETIERHIGDYKIEKLGFVELIILRMAVYEMMYEKIPVAVMINEAVELAKKYCAEKSPALINAILDKIKNSEVDHV